MLKTYNVLAQEPVTQATCTGEATGLQSLERIDQHAGAKQVTSLPFLPWCPPKEAAQGHMHEDICKRFHPSSCIQGCGWYTSSATGWKTACALLLQHARQACSPCLGTHGR